MLTFIVYYEYDFYIVLINSWIWSFAGSPSK